MEKTEQTYIIKRREAFEGLLLRADKPAIAEYVADLLQEAPTLVFAIVNEVIASGKLGALTSLGRIGLAVANARKAKQFAEEVKEYQRKNRIAENFVEERHGYETWIDVFRIIDEESPDEERLEAIKAMFFAANGIAQPDHLAILAYQMFQIAKKLRSIDLMALKLIYEKRNTFQNPERTMFVRDWARSIAANSAVGLEGLILNAEQRLTDEALITPRVAARSGYNTNTGPAPPINSVEVRDGRLSDLGLRFCENLERYRIEKKKE